MCTCLSMGLGLDAESSASLALPAAALEVASARHTVRGRRRNCCRCRHCCRSAAGNCGCGCALRRLGAGSNGACCFLRRDGGSTGPAAHAAGCRLAAAAGGAAAANPNPRPRGIPRWIFREVAYPGMLRLRCCRHQAWLGRELCRRVRQLANYGPYKSMSSLTVREFLHSAAPTPRMREPTRPAWHCT